MCILSCSRGRHRSRAITVISMRPPPLANLSYSAETVYQETSVPIHKIVAIFVACGTEPSSMASAPKSEQVHLRCSRLIP